MEFDIEIICPRCREEKTIQSDKDSNGFPIYKLCDVCISKIKQTWIKKINSKGIEYERFTLDKFVVSKENQKQFDVVKSFAGRKIDRFGLWLYSPNTGNGKTHLAIAALKHWIENSYVPKLDRNGFVECPYSEISEPELLLKIRSSYNNGSDLNESEILDEYKNVEFLVLDDLGKTNASDLSFMQRTIYTIIDARNIGHRLTVFTSNKNGAELQQYLGMYTFDRMRGMSHKVTEIHGESHRGK